MPAGYCQAVAQVNADGKVGFSGTVTIWGVTSTVGGARGAGADPNKVVTIIDRAASVQPAPDEHFVTIDQAGAGEALRGDSLTPGPGGQCQ